MRDARLAFQVAPAKNLKRGLKKYVGRRKLWGQVSSFFCVCKRHSAQLFFTHRGSRKRERGASLTEVHGAAGRGRQIFVTLERVVHLVHPGASIGSRLLFKRRSGRQLAGIASSHHLLFWGQKGKVEKKKKKHNMGNRNMHLDFHTCTMGRHGGRSRDPPPSPAGLVSKVVRFRAHAHQSSFIPNCAACSTNCCQSANSAARQPKRTTPLRHFFKRVPGNGGKKEKGALVSFLCCLFAVNKRMSTSWGMTQPRLAWPPLLLMNDIGTHDVKRIEPVPRLDSPHLHRCQ